MKFRSNKGFTLIELLVVIAIIGILASVVLASLNSARAKARDTRRKSDLRQIANALELYKNQYGTYVVAGTGSGGSGTGWFAYAYLPSKAVSTGLVDEGLLPQEVFDPSGAKTGNISGRTGYMISASADRYQLHANLENPSAADIATQDTVCKGAGYKSYTAAYPEEAKTNYCVGF